MRYDLVTLKLFLAVVEEGNIARAALREHIAASAVSKRISDLEATLGTPLLVRHTKGVEPTAAGSAMVRHARSLFGIIDRMQGELSEYAEGLRGHVSIAANTSALLLHLPEELAAFATAQAGITVGLEQMTSSRVVEAVLDGVADLGLHAVHVDLPPGLESIPYRGDQLVAVLPVDNPLATRESIEFRDMLAYDHVVLRDDASLRALLSGAARDAKEDLRMRLTVTSFDAVMRLVEARLGVAVLPAGCVRPHIGRMAIVAVPLSDGWARRDLVITMRDREALTVPARLLLAQLLTATEGARAVPGLGTPD